MTIGARVKFRLWLFFRRPQQRDRRVEGCPNSLEGAAWAAQGPPDLTALDPDLVREAVQLLGGIPTESREKLKIYLLAEWRHRQNVSHEKLLRSIIDQLTNKHTKGTDVPRRLPFSPAEPDKPNVPQWDFYNRHGYRPPPTERRG
ncbi:MAG: hypothetical protein JO100_10135 [Pseudonocardia sp.]|nr:hypothetical protein [Pseudonocardia sp.]